MEGGGTGMDHGKPIPVIGRCSGSGLRPAAISAFTEVTVNIKYIPDEMRRRVVGLKLNLLNSVRLQWRR